MRIVSYTFRNIRIVSYTFQRGFRKESVCAYSTSTLLGSRHHLTKDSVNNSIFLLEYVKRKDGNN